MVPNLPDRAQQAPGVLLVHQTTPMVRPELFLNSRTLHTRTGRAASDELS